MYNETKPTERKETFMDINGKTYQRSKLSEQIADQLEEEILSGGKIGDRLPSEQQLAERFEASRTIVREALKILRARGLIDSRTGSGAYTTRPDVQDLSHMISRIILMDKQIDYRSIYDVRICLETAAARSAAQRASDADFEALQEILNRLQNYNLGVLERRDLDFGFHQALARYSCNPLLALLVETMANVFKDVIKIGIFIEGGIDDAIVRHQRILDALKARDGALAERMMFEHLDQSRKNYESYYNM